MMAVAPTWKLQSLVPSSLLRRYNSYLAEILQGLRLISEQHAQSLFSVVDVSSAEKLIAACHNMQAVLRDS